MKSTWQASTIFQCLCHLILYSRNLKKARSLLSVAVKHAQLRAQIKRVDARTDWKWRKTQSLNWLSLMRLIVSVINLYMNNLRCKLLSGVTSLNHPFHLHGTAFFVISMGQHPDKLPMTVAMARRMNTAKKLSRINKPSTAYPIKDTVSIPSKGYAVFRFKAYNPGYWLLHCHYGGNLNF